jgi:hypothetical protein
VVVRESGKLEAVGKEWEETEAALLIYVERTFILPGLDRYQSGVLNDDFLARSDMRLHPISGQRSSWKARRMAGLAGKVSTRVRLGLLIAFDGRGIVQQSSRASVMNLDSSSK